MVYTEVMGTRTPWEQLSPKGYGSISIAWYVTPMSDLYKSTIVKFWKVGMITSMHILFGLISPVIYVKELDSFFIVYGNLLYSLKYCRWIPT